VEIHRTRCSSRSSRSLMSCSTCSLRRFLRANSMLAARARVVGRVRESVAARDRGMSSIASQGGSTRAQLPGVPQPTTPCTALSQPVSSRRSPPQCPDPVPRRGLTTIPSADLPLALCVTNDQPTRPVRASTHEHECIRGTQKGRVECLYPVGVSARRRTPSGATTTATAVSRLLERSHSESW
jgi:hypothetical protein